MLLALLKLYHSLQPLLFFIIQYFGFIVVSTSLTDGGMFEKNYEYFHSFANFPHCYS